MCAMYANQNAEKVQSDCLTINETVLQRSFYSEINSNNNKTINYCAFGLYCRNENNWSAFQHYNVNNSLGWPISMSTPMKKAWFLLLSLVSHFFSILIIAIHHHRVCVCFVVFVAGSSILLCNAKCVCHIAFHGNAFGIWIFRVDASIGILQLILN